MFSLILTLALASNAGAFDQTQCSKEEIAINDCGPEPIKVQCDGYEVYVSQGGYEMDESEQVEIFGGICE